MITERSKILFIRMINNLTTEQFEVYLVAFLISYEIFDSLNEIQSPLAQ